MRSIRKLILLAAASTAWTVVAPAILSAQASGVGADGWTRFYWTGTDSSLALWKIDSNLLNPVSKGYGPYLGYYPKGIAVGSDNLTRVLWNYTDGSISLWLVDANLNYISNTIYGPYPGWVAESISIEYTSNRLRVVWRETTGQVAIWILGANLSFVTSHDYGPYFGYVPDYGYSSADSTTPAEMQRVSTVPVPK